MRRLPSGTVTLLFSDIEGSTKLLHRAGDSYADLLSAHRRLMRQAFARHRGVEVDTEGDAFFVAFAAADDAVAAAASAQAALAAHDWPGGNDVRVRIGLHTGTPRIVDGGYVGLDVHHAARVMAAGHGGQVLLSNAVRMALSRVRPLVDLGEHRLKDLLQPEHLFQLLIHGLPSEFPALKTLSNRPTNLPAQPNPLIGREREIEEIIALLRGSVRLLTLTGVGGTGKTRLALQVGAELLEEFRSGVYFVSLTPVSDTKLVVPTIAQTLGLREIAGEAIAETLNAYLADKRMLLVIDNFEQVVDAAPSLAAIAAATEEVSLLVTSRMRLRVLGERLFEVPPLETETGSELFVARAQAADPSFTVVPEDNPVIEEISRRLDGLPLALELAAARVAVLPPRVLLERLDERLALLTSGTRDAEERQQTLRKTIEWSYDLLGDADRSSFERLSVFVDGCRLDAAEAVCGAGIDALQSLIEKSLLRRRSDDDAEPRYWMLETIREYALGRLRSTEAAEQMLRAHADYFLRLAEGAEARSGNPDASDAYRTMERDRENLRLALSWLRESESKALFVRLAAALGHFWAIRGDVSEGRRWLEAALAVDVDEPYAKQEALRYAFWMSVFGGDLESAEALARERVRSAELSGDDRVLAAAVGALARVAQMQGDMERARELQSKMVEFARRSGDESLTGNALANLGAVALRCGDYEGARIAAEDSLQIAARIGEAEDVLWMLIPRDVLAESFLRVGRLGEAEALYRENLRGMHAIRQADDSEVAWAVGALAAIAALQGDLRRAARLAGIEERMRAGIEEVQDSHRRELSEELYLGPLRNAGDPELQAVWDEGRALSLEDGVRYALERPPSCGHKDEAQRQGI
jgi:predicted ATPase/class 3 adenylate cyclase